MKHVSSIYIRDINLPIQRRYHSQASSPQMISFLMYYAYRPLNRIYVIILFVNFSIDINGELTICEVTSNGEIVNGIQQSKWLEYRLIQNSNITLKCCRPSAVPNLTITWNLKKKTPTGDSITYKEDNTILEINNIVNNQHAGFYECIGSHPTLGETTQLSEIEVRIRDEGKRWGSLMFNTFRIYS